ncbi:hypothetical protein [Streptomyces paludis]|uniref:Uncharacterized protein n=1 Tax=Streptomyces paludis TaxID=2282738 RepID=A0A345HWQ0_9ACTN|nr:hypothetical protein [Streptomyces paludis]AXG81124.1 hypothetical protein DVK44_29425 [Streptomyces paludis]
MNDTDQPATDYDGPVGGLPEPLPAFPEHHPNPHNFRFTVSLDGRGPMIVARGHTAADINAAFQELEDAGVTTLLASVYSHMKAEMAVASGVGPVSPAPPPQGPPAPPAPPQGVPVPGAGVNYNPVTPPPGIPGTAPAAWQNAGAPPPPQPPAPQYGGAPQGAAGARNAPKMRPADWPQVYKVSLARGDTSFKEYRAANQQYFKGKILWAGGGDYWIHGEVAQALAQWNPVPA